MKDYVRLKELNLNQEENSMIQYIMKSDFIRKIIKKEIKLMTENLQSLFNYFQKY